MNNIGERKHHGKTTLILAVCLCMPFIAIWYITGNVNENIFYEQKKEHLLVLLVFSYIFMLATIMIFIRRINKSNEKRDKILNIINSVASVLLAETNEENFEESLLGGMEIIGQNMEADCVQIWPNEMRDGKLHFVLKYKWSSDTGKKAPPVEIGTAVPYSARWKELFFRGECVNGPIAHLPQEDQDLLSPLGLLSTITIPLYYQDKFWGVFCVDDIAKERYFTQNEINMLYSATLMLVNAINRNLIQRELRATLEEIENVIEQNKLQITKLDMAIQASKVGLWEMEIVKDDPVNPNNIFIWSNELRHMLGYKDENDFPNILCSWSDLLHPDDKERSLEAFAKHLLDITGKTPYDIEYRLLKKDGEYSYYRAAGATVRDKNGDLVRVVGTLVDITETKNIILDSERQRIEAEAASKAKSNFLRTMSHEIRTPMNAIIGMTTIGKLTGEIQKKDDALKKIEGASKHLLGIINDVLDMSKIEADKLELSPVSFDFEKMLQKIADVINLRVDERRQKFFVHIGDNMPQMLFGDDQRLAQVITNLLSNAVKFTPEEGTIRLDSRLVSEEGGMCRLQISVEDTGIGITDEQKARLFKSFEQAEATTTRKYGGTGLGLAITKRIVELMGGEIRLESKPGKGSKFTFTFLMKRDAGAKKRLPDENDRFGIADEPGYSDDFSGYSILLADDVEINREILLSLLEPMGLSVDCAENGAQALKMFEGAQAKYSMIFMDIQMPEMDGYEATRQIRAIGSSWAKDVPIIAMTANVFREDIEKSLDAGMNGHIGKPIDFGELTKEARKYLR
ncbi:MAG: ATP-binding protein [Oscillospiraceae bacterium]|nr:ATP-binding protein [Oscillospiraceae bacterium]